MHLGVILSFVWVGLLLPYGPPVTSPASGTLEITFELNPADTEEFAPSYQTVVWLETAEGEYLRSLLVSEYISYGGFLVPEVCPRWNGVSNWEQNYEHEMDAVTAATPRVEKNVLRLDCGKEKLVPGFYRYHVQTHIVEDYNILFSGDIRIGGEEDENVAEASFSPRRHPGADKVLDQVKARFYHQ